MVRPQPRTSSEEEDKSSPIDLIVAQLEGGPYYTRSKAAEITGIPKNTLRYWQYQGITKAPSLTHHQGGMTIHLYTPEDIAEIKARRPAGQTRIRKRIA